MKAVPGLLAVLLMLSSTSLAQTAPTPTQQPDAASQPSTESPSPAAPLEEVATVPAAAFVPGAKLFLEPMNGFDQFMARAFVTKKVPVVVVKERADADFVVDGDTRLKKPNFVTGMVLDNRGKGHITVTDARTGNVVFTDKFSRVNQMVTDYYIYQGWAEAAAKHMRKVLVPKKK